MRTWSCLLALAAALPAEDPAAGLLSPDVEKRRETAFALAAWPDAVAAVPILVDLTEDDDERVREVAAVALTRLGRKALPSYFRFLGDPDDPARPAFLEQGALVARLGSALTAADLHLPLTSASAAERRAGAASAILAVTVEDGLDSTLDVLSWSCGDPDASVRAMAATSLALLGWDEGSENATEEEMQPVLQALAWDQVAVRRAGACLVLLLKPMASEFHEAFNKARDGPIDEAAERRGFVIVLGGAVGTRLRDLLPKLDVLEREPRPKPTDPDWGQKHAQCTAALRAMRECKLDEEVAARLSRLLAQDFGGLRIEIARTLLSDYPDRADEAVKASIEVLTARVEAGLSEDQRRLAILGRLDALDLLLELGPKAKPAVWAFAEVLGWKEDPETEGDGDLAARSARHGALFWHVRRAKRAAADALGAFGKDAAEAKPALTALLSHGDLRLRYRAARALRRIGP